MAQHQFTDRASNQPQQSRLQRAVFLPSLGLLSGISLFTAQDGFAQTPVSEPVPVQPATPTAPETAPVAPPPPIAPESFPVEFSTPAAAPAPPPQSVAPVAPAPPAPDAYIAPSTIIFSERSTGCQATVRSGQAPGSVCGSAGTSQINVPGWQGANGQPAGNVSAIGIGSLSVVAPSVKIGSTPSLRDFYRRTMRPPGRLGNGNVRLIFPLSIPAPISSLFGWRLHPITGDPRFHSGTDLAAPLGTPVLAAYAGQVALADFLGGYGLAVAIDHTKGTQQTLYAHLSEVFVKSGDVVKQGDVIGRVGSTGNSTGPHLHFEFRQLTTEGWVALDAGEQLEYALAQLVNSLEIAQASFAPVKANAGAQGVIQ
ncbi:MAG: M23 family metallopeptidase [Leptolyngbyaceae cyanobacterium bins.302]|nr:M23 family metallopeptidase [Leptolyngbyaceae cyanobacterium bins.302]